MEGLIATEENLMDENHSDIPVRELLEHTAFLRRLSQRLVRSESEVDDLVQDTWVAALRRSPTEGWNLKSWLSGVTRNLARRNRRAEARRLRREEAAAHSEEAPPTGDAGERLESLRILVEAVRSLEEPYRAVILHRYFEDLSPREIAGLHGIPLATVYTRLRRGRESLRERLDREWGGDRKGWTRALAPLCVTRFVKPEEVVQGAMHGGGAVMMPAVKIAAGILGGLGVAVLVWGNPLSTGMESSSSVDGGQNQQGVVARMQGKRPSTPAALDPGVRDQASTPGPPLIAPLPPIPEESSGDDPEDEGEPALTRPSIALSGRVCLGPTLDPLGRAPVRLALYAGATVWGDPLLEETFIAGEDGSFSRQLASPDEAATLVLNVAEPGYVGGLHITTITPGTRSLDSVWLHALPLDTRITGAVRDAQGSPVEGASIVVASVMLSNRPPPWLYQGSPVIETAALSDEQGRFEVMGPSFLRRIEVAVTSPGLAYASDHLPLQDSGEKRVDFVLHPGFRLTGRVVDEDSTPVAGARVRVPDHSAVPWSLTDAEGRYEVDHLDPEKASHRISVSCDGYPEATVHLSTRGGDQSRDIVLERGLAVEGVVLGPDGEPLSGAVLTIEGPGGLEVVSAGDGSFLFRGLTMRSYDVLVCHGDLAPLAQTIDVRPSQEDPLEIRLEEAHSLGGIIRDVEGRPIAGAFLSFSVVGPSGSGRGGAALHRLSITDETGRFRADGLPSPLHVRVGALGFASRDTELEPDEEDVEIVLTREGEALVPEDEDDAGSPSPLLSTLGGRVLSAESSEPIARATVWLRPAFRRPVRTSSPGHPADPELETRTDSAGAFLLEGIPASTGSLLVEGISAEAYCLSVSHPDWGLTVEEPFEIPEGVTLPPRTVLMHRGVTVEGVASDEEGRPMAGITVTLGRDLPGVPGESCTTDSGGRFLLHGVKPGRYTLDSRVSRHTKTVVFVGARLTVGREDTRSLRLGPEGSARISGIVRHERELPEGLTFFVWHQPVADPPWEEFLPSRGGFVENGAFEVRGLPAGRYRISVSFREELTGEWVDGWTLVEVGDSEAVSIVIDVRS